MSAVQPESPAVAASQKRIEGTFYLMLVLLIGLAYRLVQLQALEPDKATGLSLPADSFTKTQLLPAQRGQILAADGTAFAVTIEEYNVAINPRGVAPSDRAKMARRLADTIGGDPARFEAQLAKVTRPNGAKNFYVRLAKGVSAERIAKLRALMAPPRKKDAKGKLVPAPESKKARKERRDFWAPLTLEPAPRRDYPLGNLAAQTIGFTAKSGWGFGLESAYNKRLKGADGEIVSQVDSQQRPIPGFVQQMRPPLPGQSVVTTLDPQIQAATDATMRDLWQQYKPKSAVAIVMRPKTGEIVALSTTPSFDLNRRPKDTKALADMALNRAVNLAYEPGSTFKIITACAAVENVPDWRQHHFVCNGVQHVGKHNMHCWINSTSKRRHGDEDLSESIRDSCNFGVYGFSRLVGAPKMLKYAADFGLHEKCEVAPWGEQKGYLPTNDPRAWSPEQLANFAFGQGMTLTPLQLARVAATVANGGVMMKPMLVKEWRDEDGTVVERFKPQVLRRVIKPETARLVTSMMERVTTEGTASKFIFVPGYITAGKTGSAQKAEGKRGYAAGKFISSFVGFLPSRAPEFVILIMADEPHGSHWGSEVCGPAYVKIAKSAMLSLRLTEGASAPAPNPALMVQHKKKKV